MVRITRLAMLLISLPPVVRFTILINSIRGFRKSFALNGVGPCLKGMYKCGTDFAHNSNVIEIN